MILKWKNGEDWRIEEKKMKSFNEMCLFLVLVLQYISYNKNNNKTRCV